MTHAVQPHFIDIIGMFTGALAMSIAIILQLIVDRKCNWRYVTGFYIFGAIMFIIHLGPVVENGMILTVTRIVLYTVIIILEILAGYTVYKKSPDESLASVKADYLHEKGDD